MRGNAPAVAALRGAGAVLLGKANLHEVGVGMTGLNLAHGTARNPHDPARFCGGSSSGCAAAVAAGVCPFAIGAQLRMRAALLSICLTSDSGETHMLLGLWYIVTSQAPPQTLYPHTKVTLALGWDPGARH